MKQDPKDDKNAPVKTENTQVGFSAKRNIVVMGIFGAVFLLVLYNAYSVIFPSNDSSKQKDVSTPKLVVKPSKALPDNNFALPKVPAAPSIVPPSLDSSIKPLPTLATPLPPALPSIDKSVSANSGGFKPPSSLTAAVVEAANEKSSNKSSNQDARRKANIVAFGGAPSKISEQQKNRDSNVVKKDSVTFKGNARYLLAAGKMINAIVESAINSSIGGDLRAIISNDVYSQSGKVVLIPRGSRLFGSYSAGEGTPLGRIEINWNRVDLPNGYTVDLTGAAVGVNNLTQRGVFGKVDRKILQQLTSSVLSSIVNIAVAKGLDTISPPQQTTVSLPNASAIANIQAVASGITSNASLAVSVQATQLCRQVLPLIQQVNPTVFTTLQTSVCNGSMGSSPENAIAAFNAQVPLLTTSNSVTSTNSQMQQATQSAYQDFGNTIKNITKSDAFAPVVTIPQGTSMQVYVNQDFLFPAESIYKVND